LTVNALPEIEFPDGTETVGEVEPIAILYPAPVTVPEGMVTVRVNAVVVPPLVALYATLLT
jgi:hypothetical protein